MNTRKPLTNAGNRHNKQIAAMLAMGVQLEIKSRRHRNASWAELSSKEEHIRWVIHILLNRNPNEQLLPYLWRRKLY